MLGQSHDVTVVDIDKNKVKAINNKKSPIQDDLINSFLESEKSKIHATDKLPKTYSNTDLYIIALPSNYDEKLNHFDTKIIEESLKKITLNVGHVPILIRSTVPVGFTERIKLKLKNERILFSPEFLREGSALHDNLNPSRIIVGGEGADAESILQLLDTSTLNKPEKFIMSSGEAESVKLFSNSYLALRVAYFNELDSFCMRHNLRTKKIIDGVSADERIGKGYNNPSFGYGGYCLPKDTKQLLANYDNVPQNIIEATVNANAERKKFISKILIDMNCTTYGIYRLAMKKGSDNMRESSVQCIIEDLINKNKNVIIFEPMISKENFKGCSIEKDFTTFKERSDVIISNRISSELQEVANKVFSRDVFFEN